MICGKVIYKSRSEANAALAGANRDKRSKSPKGRLSNSYFCNDCDGWHVASKKKSRYGRWQSKEVDTSSQIHHAQIENNKKQGKLIIRNLTSKPI